MEKINIKKFNKNYDPAKYPRPSVAVDLMICTMINTELHVLLIERSEHPFKGYLSLPGGFMRVNEDLSNGEELDETAIRILAQKTHIPRDMVYLEQLYTFSHPTRDPRTRVISVSYFALIPPDFNRVIELNADSEDYWVPASSLVASEVPSEVPASSSTREATEVPASSTASSSTREATEVPASSTASSTTEMASSSASSSLLTLAFDHNQMIQTMLSRLETKLELSEIAFALVPKTFTVSELRNVYEKIKHSEYDASNFRRRFKRWISDQVIELAPGKRLTGSRPAKVYQRVTQRVNR